jgi:site-specific recombinase
MFRKEKPVSSIDLLEHYFDASEHWKEVEDDYEPLVQIVDAIRPRKAISSKVDISLLLLFFQENETLTQRFAAYLQLLFSDKKLANILTDAEILKDVDFLYEVKKRIGEKILPHQPQKNTLEFVLNHVFYKDTDPIWIETIPLQQLKELFELVTNATFFDQPNKRILNEILHSMNLLTQRMSGRVLESEVVKMVPEYEKRESSFTAFEKELVFLNAKLNNFSETVDIANDLTIKQLKLLHKQCEEFVAKAFQNSSVYGISLRVNQNLLRIRQQLARVKALLSFVSNDTHVLKVKNSVFLIKALIKYNCHKSNISELIKESTQLIAYEITHHTAKTGEKYITNDKKEYLTMLYTALGGGFIVGILCIIKLYFSKVTTSDFGHAFLYSMNYAVGFIAIYLLGFTLATKQPAMTASALVSTLKADKRTSKKGQETHTAFALFYARVFRSQFIAFLGNVVMAFPVALLGIWLLYWFNGYDIAESKWQKLVTDISPVDSKAILHASVAGVYLFLSGIMSGSIANRHKHDNVQYRIQEHTFLKRRLGKRKAKQFSKWYAERMPAVIANFWFGVCLGSTGTIAHFLGLDIDIRHITFASGNFALALFGSNYSLTNDQIFWAIIGIGIIGLMNFLVSFILSLSVALRSRAIPISELRPIVFAIFQLFKKKPLLFFLPIKEPEL